MKRRRSYDGVEVLLILSVAVLLAFGGGREFERRQPLGEGMLMEGQQLRRQLASRYGGRASRNAEEWIIRHFLEIGAAAFF